MLGMLGMLGYTGGPEVFPFGGGNAT